MKFPSIFRTNSPMRFDIKPRYYDPVKEEIEQRTSQIKKDLEAQGLLDKSGEEGENYESSIRGSFANYRGGIKERSKNPFSSTAMIRTMIILFLVGSLFGYIYFGPIVFEIIAYSALLIIAIYLFFRLKPKKGR
ncbi:hypothetical protein [Algoriphagus sediminis]|uniref:DUF2335 domain-containing protein n=1 Tax=Algoriphagus sediminis TaxID=3057113 RepID=A0ABT7YEM7_9BACT|nr:hypothetical protein [Algoriphagus sediminis]MDN3204958.1 hypothetical protein [Algoriphagus sediminis]